MNKDHYHIKILICWKNGVNEIKSAIDIAEKQISLTYWGIGHF